MNDPVRAALESIVAYFDDAKQWTRSDQTYLSGVSPRIEPSRAALASDAGSVGALDVERLARLTWEAAEDATDFEDYRQRLTLSLDAERQGERA